MRRSGRRVPYDAPLWPLLLGVIVGVGAWMAVSRSQASLLQARFELHATRRDAALREGIADTLAFLEIVASFFEAAEQVNPRSFQLFTQPLLERNPALQALSWNPLVRIEEREAFETQVSEALGIPFQITERGADGMVRAGSRREYVAVRYIEPYQGNESAMGFDIRSEERRRTAIDRALRTGELAITAPITLVQEREEALGLLALVPVPREQPEGFAVSVVRVPDIISAAVSASGEASLSTRLYDATDSEEQLLYAWPEEPPAVRDPSLQAVSTVDIGGRQWRIELAATERYIRQHRSADPFGVSVASGLMVLLLGNYRQSRRREQALTQESKERLELTLEAVTVGAWDWDLQTGAVFFSDSWLRSLGLEREAVAEHISTWQRLLHPDDRDAVEQARAAHLEGRQPRFTVRNRLRTGSGAYRWNETRGQVVLRAQDGTPLRMVGTDSDISAQVAAEEEQQRLSARAHHTQKLEKLGLLAGGIAHDFNNLLTVIMSTADIMLMARQIGPDVRRDVSVIRKTAEHAATLTRQMLDYAGRSPRVLSWLELDDLIEDITSLLLASIPKKIHLKIEPGEDLPPIQVDAAQIHQVILNLITNAAGAIGEGSGTITLRTSEVHLDAEALSRPGIFGEPSPGHYVCLCVQDDGCGIAPEILPSIFDPFYTTREQGRGLGLSVVLGTVRNHFGGVAVHSVPGGGTRFEIYLPVSDVQSEAMSSPAREEPPREEPGVVLVVDDEPSVRSATCGILEHAGFSVLEAEDGLGGLAVFHESADRIDALVLDMSMPGLSGAEVIERIHDTHPSTPIVLYSGYSQPGSLERVLQAETVRFLRKPFRAAALIEAVRAVIAERADQ